MDSGDRKFYTVCLCEFPMDEKSEAKKKDRELIHCRKKRTEFSSHTLHPNGRAQRGLNTSRQPTQNGNWGCYTIYGPSFRTKLINKQNYYYQQLLLMEKVQHTKGIIRDDLGLLQQAHISKRKERRPISRNVVGTCLVRGIMSSTKRRKERKHAWQRKPSPPSI